VGVSARLGPAHDGVDKARGVEGGAIVRSRAEASGGPRGAVDPRETERETGAVVGPDLNSARETARETRASELLTAGEAS